MSYSAFIKGKLQALIDEMDVWSGDFCNDTPVQTVEKPDTVSVIVSVPRAIRFGLFVALAHFAHLLRISSRYCSAAPRSGWCRLSSSGG